ncbi:MAG: 3'-5' exonuclease [Gammaproteobacteria bacterium]|nr:3'-5' exonuclease [Gammaproteobacteria bacterium]
MNVFAFDIETIPDVAAGKQLLGMHDIDDADVARAMFHIRRQQTGHSEFLQLHLHKVVAISVAMRSRDSFRVWSLGDPDSDEAELIRRFFDGIDRYTPQLVSWNGSGFDLPVLHYRMLVHGISAPRYWESGDNDRDFRFNNYLSRYHSRHLDLMDVLAGYQPRAAAPLDQTAVLCGLPGKLGMDGGKVWGCYLAGEIEAIRDYCESDALNTFLLYLRFEKLRGNLTSEEYEKECAVIREVLREQDLPHLNEFLDAWKNAGSKQTASD